MSYRLLQKSNYFRGPESVISSESKEIFSLTVPNPLVENVITSRTECCVATERCTERIWPLTVSSSLYFLLSVVKKVLKFINNLKRKVKAKKPYRFTHFDISNPEITSNKALEYLIIDDQKEYFPEIFNFFNISNIKTKPMPNLIAQLNVYPDESGILRVKSKFERWKDDSKAYPILLYKNSPFTEMIVM